MVRTYEKQVHPLAPTLRYIFFESAGWPGNRLISAVNEGRESDIEIQGFEEFKKVFRSLGWIGEGHCAEMKCLV